MVDLQNSFTAIKSNKFSTKSILACPPHLKYVAALPGRLKNQKFAILMRIKHVWFKCDFLSSIQQIKEMRNVVKISAKIKTMQNINILLFVCSLSLTSLEPIDHQASIQ